jgi:hypothetical protein
MRDLEKTAMMNTKKSDSDMIKLGRDQAIRDTAQEKVCIDTFNNGFRRITVKNKFPS